MAGGFKLSVEIVPENPEDLARLVEAYQIVCDASADREWDVDLRRAKLLLRQSITSLRIRGARPKTEK